jgi:hypothetical protein
VTDGHLPRVFGKPITRKANKAGHGVECQFPLVEEQGNIDASSNTQNAISKSIPKNKLYSHVKFIDRAKREIFKRQQVKNIDLLLQLEGV